VSDITDTRCNHEVHRYIRFAEIEPLNTHT